MVLKEDMALGCISEVGPVLVLAVGHEGVPLLVIAVVFKEFDAIEPVLHVFVSDNDEGGVPDTDVEGFLLRGRDEVVEGTELSVAFHAEFGIGVAFIVKNLELTADGRACAFVHVRINKVFDAAVGAVGNFEIYGEHEVAVLANSDNVASVGALAATGLVNDELAVLDAPTLLWEVVEASATPTIGRLAVPKEMPAVFLLAGGESVVAG